MTTLTPVNVLDLKDCARCGGDTVKRVDQYGHYRECLQCGSHTYFEAFKRKWDASKNRNATRRKAK